MGNKAKKQKTKKGKASRPQSDPVAILDNTPDPKRYWFHAMSMGDRINLVMACLTFFSVVLVGVGLKQSAIARNNTYRPSILPEVVDIQYQWNENGYPSWLITDRGIEDTSATYDPESDSFTTKVTIPLQIVTPREKIGFENIGVGTARNIIIEWNEGNTQRLYDYVKEGSQEYDDFCVIGDASVVFTYGDIVTVSDCEIPTQISYLLPNAEKKIDIYFPAYYTQLIGEFIRNPDVENHEPYPFLLLTITYEDIQGVKYSDIFVIYINKMKLEQHEDGSGNCVFRLSPVLI